MARILVVDDTKNIRKMVRLALEQAGHRVETAEDGLQALEAFGDGLGWDLTLVDHQMPGEQGREVIVEARRRDPAARLVMMTAFATTELAAQVLAAGAFDFLRKPFSAEVLRGTVTAALAQPRQSLVAALSPDTESAATEAILPVPGEPGFVIPRVSWRINGFGFWPVALPHPHVPGMEFGRLFQIRKPDGELTQCFVGITPHIRDQVQRDSGRELPDDDPIWESLCGQAVVNKLWETAEAPPDVLPIYEVPEGSRGSSRRPVPWGPFGGW